MSELLAEIRKIPPVTRFICVSIVSVTLPVMAKIVSPYKMIFVKEFVTRRLEVCLFTPHSWMPQLNLNRSGESIPLSSLEVRSYIL